jgi:hypothetical protein
MDNLNIEAEKEGRQHRQSCLASVINQIKELFTDVQELY